MHVIHCWVREGVAADLDGDDLVVLVDAHAKFCREQIPILIPGRVGSACGQARVGGHITVLSAVQDGVSGDENHTVSECSAKGSCMIGMRACFKHVKLMP